MRHLISQNKLPEQFGNDFIDFISRPGGVSHMETISHTHYCSECGTEFYGVGQWITDPLIKYEGKWNDRQSLKSKRDRLNENHPDYQYELKK